MIANSIATLDELSGGRAILGIGVGESAVRTIGMPPATLGKLREVTEAVRSLLKGETTTYDGAQTRLSWATREVPIFFSSSGPRPLRLAGEIADGVVFQVGSAPQLISYALRNIQLGLEQGGRDAAGVKRYVRLACSVDTDRARAREDVKGYLPVAAGTVYWAVPKDDIPDGLWEDIDRMKAQYDYFQHGRAQSQQSALITERMIDLVAIAGTPDEVVPRLRELVDLGVDGFVIPIARSEPKRQMQMLAEKVIPRVQARTSWVS